MLVERTLCLTIFGLFSRITLVIAEDCPLGGKTHRHTAIKSNIGRRQEEVVTPAEMNNQTGMVTPGSIAGKHDNYTTEPVSAKSSKRRQRRTASRVSFVENCDYLIKYCTKMYDTGTICARTVYLTYSTFKNYCMMDYINCMERYDVWHIVYMGKCLIGQHLEVYEQYPYLDDYFLDQMYLVEM